MNDLAKECTKCNIVKTLDSFNLDVKGKYGKASICKNCKQNYNRNEKIVIMRIYSHQREASKRRGYEMPTYSRDELEQWLYKNGFKEFYNNWVGSNYNKNLYPSIDRIDNYKAYSFGNIRLGTFKENHKAFSDDILNAKNKGQERCKRVYKYSLDNIFLNTYHSTLEAKRKTGIVKVRDCAKGRRKTAGGFKWSYFCPISNLKDAGNNIISEKIQVSGTYIASYRLVLGDLK